MIPSESMEVQKIEEKGQIHKSISVISYNVKEKWFKIRIMKIHDN